MQKDFHYYATYCAAYIAGYSHEESLCIAYSDQFCDCCTRTLLSKVGSLGQAATTQLQLELVYADNDTKGIWDITRIWASFHFLPRDLYADVKKGFRRYKEKYRLICGPNGSLVKDTVELAKDSSLQAVGIAMHVLSDTWAHTYFAGTPSMVINDTNYDFFELIKDADGYKEKEIEFRHSVSQPDDLENSIYTNSLQPNNERSIMNLGHGRAGHLPDYSFARYKYMPAWDDFREKVKDNPSDYFKAFTQMIYAMKFIRGDIEEFELDRYDTDAVDVYKDEIMQILEKRQLDSCDDWKRFGEKLSGMEIEDFDAEKYQKEIMDAQNDEKDKTFIGKFVIASMKHKSMVTNRIYKSGNRLAGVSVDYHKKGFRGLRDFKILLKKKLGGEADE